MSIEEILEKNTTVKKLEVKLVKILDEQNFIVSDADTSAILKVEDSDVQKMLSDGEGKGFRYMNILFIDVSLKTMF